MRLINVKTYELEEHVNLESYAILSHTWHDHEEVLFKDFTESYDKSSTKRGWRKVDFLCDQAVKDQLQYVWIDTVCIDKTSSAELSEAINSMFAWYQEAKICYVYLDDVDEVSDIPKCRWITRGWTLQELLAPANVRFYNRDWIYIGTKTSLVVKLAQCTRIDEIALTDATTIRQHSAATRMSWAAMRRTTRIEDVAYCLLGIFGVNMPLLYGEREKAFIRLQEEIVKQDRDITILAFNRYGLGVDEPNLFARSPDIFGSRPKVISETSEAQCELTGRGLRLKVGFLQPPEENEIPDVVLDCRYEFDPDHLIALQVMHWERPSDSSTSSDYLINTADLVKVPRKHCSNIRHETILLLHKTYTSEGKNKLQAMRFICSVKGNELLERGYDLLYATPEGGANSWDSTKMISEVVSSTPIMIRKFAFVHYKRNEAFVLMVADDRNRRLWGADGRVWLSTKAKPLTVDCISWLKQQDMYSVLKQPSASSGWHQDSLYETESNLVLESQTIDRVQWTLAEYPHSAGSLKLYLSLASEPEFGQVQIWISRPATSQLHVHVQPS